MSVVPRTVTEADDDRSRPLAVFHDAGAFVLLGDPGAGKTTEFRREVDALGADALFLPARDFLAFAGTRAAEWSGKTLFVDGLDEIRAGKGDPRTPLDEIRRRLDALGRPRFRLSCRAADWLGPGDRERLRAVSPDEILTVLRLDPLRDADIVSLLETRLPGGNASDFLQSAREKGLSGWLRNPQGLEILIEAFAAGRGWPASRREAFETACLRMAAERNAEHRDSATDQPNPAEVLDAAAELCAAVLLSGAAGCSLDASLSGDDYPALEHFRPTHRNLARAVLATPLFTATGPAARQFAPNHRQLAEFLGARHLAGRIESGLPVGRVFALMTAPDGAAPTPLRGLAAWLAAHCRPARARLIERDPVGIAAYGDIHDFSPAEKARLLRRVHDQDPKLDAGRLPEDALRSLAVPDLAPVLRQILESPGRADADQVVTGFVLRALALGEPLPEFADLLLGIARDESRWSVANRRALDAFFHNCGGQEQRREGAHRLLYDIRRGAVRDSDREMLGTLLARMVPEEIPPAELWNYLLDQPNRLIGRYFVFWRRDLFEKTPEERLPDLLETLGARLSGLRSALDAQFLDDLPLRLVARTLESVGDRTPIPRLHDWLRIGAAHWPGRPRAAESVREIRTFLEGRPDLHQALWLEGLKRCPEADDFPVRVRQVAESLYGAGLPDDFGRFCLDRASELADARPRLAEWLLQQAIQRSAEEEITLEELTERTRHRRGNLSERLPNLLQTPLPHWYLDGKREEKDFTVEQSQREAQWERQVRSEAEALRENRALPALLHAVAMAYLGTLDQYVTGPGHERWFSDAVLVEALLSGLRGVPYRQDVPEVADILRLRAESRFHYLSLPFLAGLEVIEREDPARLGTLDDTRRRTALALYCTVPTGRLELPPWYRELMRSRPDLVAEVLVRCAKPEIAAGSDSLVHLDCLVTDADHAAVAGRASLALLRGFPVRSRGTQLQVLDCLLWAALRRADRAELRKIIAKKVGSKSVTAAQRAHWLAAGLAAAPEDYRSRFDEFTRGRDEATRETAVFWCPDWHTSFPDSETDPATLSLLVRRVGAMFAPHEEWKEGIVDLPARAAERTRAFIHTLGGQPGAAAGEVLDSLLADPALADWKGTLGLARDRQRTESRDAAYAPPSVERATEALRGGLPTNSADLLALVADHLDDFAAEVRGGDENVWRGFWNEDPYGRPKGPKPENSCRDVVLRELRARLDDRIDVVPEAQHASNARADLRVSFSGFAVPIEIKREGHPGLWTGVADQLIPKYTTLPAAAGHGIYLVLWFGRHRIPRGPSGQPPTTPEELKQSLEEVVSCDDSSKVEVWVLDVTPPGGGRPPVGAARRS